MYVSETCEVGIVFKTCKEQRAPNQLIYILLVGYQPKAKLHNTWLIFISNVHLPFFLIFIIKVCKAISACVGATRKTPKLTPKAGLITFLFEGQLTHLVIELYNTALQLYNYNHVPLKHQITLLSFVMLVCLYLFFSIDCILIKYFSLTYLAERRWSDNFIYECLLYSLHKWY